MAVDLHNCELLIPSDNFDGLSMENSNTNNNKGRAYLFGSSEFGSELSSPIGLDQLSSSSTESSNSEEEEEEDCFIGEFTRQMAQYMLQDEDKHEKVFNTDSIFSSGFSLKKKKKAYLLFLIFLISVLWFNYGWEI